MTTTTPATPTPATTTATTTATAATTPMPTTPPGRARAALLAVCAGLAVNGLVLGPMWVLTPTATFSETAALPAFAVSQRLSWVLLTLLVVLVPVLLRGGRRDVPRWTAPMLQLALAAQAATNFVMGFVAPWLADIAPRTLDVPGGTFQVATTAVWVGFIVVMVVTAVVLWRSGHSRVGAVLAALGALVTPGVGPLGAGVMALGLGLVALRQRRDAGLRRQTT